MSSPGLQPDPADVQQQQQPLFGPQIGNPQLMKLQEALAQQMQQQPSGPAYSPWEVLSRVVSPLAGVIIQKHLAKQQFDMQQAAMPEIAAALQSDDPLKAMMSSKSPLVQQMALQYMPDWMKASIGLKSKVQERQILDPMDIKKSVDTATAMEPVEVKKATDISKADMPIAIQKALGIAQATLPIELAKTQAGQAATYAGQAETARHNKAMEDLGAKKSPQVSPFGQNPASMYGTAPQ